MRKVVYTLDIDNYAPEIKALTFPLMRHYARKIGADFRVITKRKFPDFPIPCEKLQLWDLSAGNDWTIYFDADTLIHPELFDVTNFIPRDHVANNGCDMASVRWTYDRYFRRDGRNIGTCGWCIIASDWTRDIWRPLDDMSMHEALLHCWPTVAEAAPTAAKIDENERPVLDENEKPVMVKKPVIDREHLLDDFVMSRNVAKYGLKYTTLMDLWKKLGMDNPAFFWHKYTIDIDEKIYQMRKIFERWNVSGYILEESADVTVAVAPVGSHCEAGRMKHAK